MTMPAAEVAARVAWIEGWLTRDQIGALHAAAADCPRGGTIVEIGSFRGRSTVALALSAPPGTTVIAIDPHGGTDRGPQEISGYAVEAEDDHATFHVNLERAGVDDRVRHVRAFSHDAHPDVTGQLDLLFIDGAHRYGPARRDIAEWGARVRPAGTMLIHDAFSSVGVTSAIIRELALGRRFRYVRRVRSLAVYVADLGAHPRARSGNLIRQVAQLPWCARNVVLKAALVAGLDRLARRLGRTPPAWPY